MKGNNQFNTFHRKTGTRLYKAWVSMKERCHNPNDSGFSRYGARGIYVCSRWRQSFAAFEADMGPRPPGASIDRIDNDGPYSPENCRWATRSEQARNKSNNRLLTCFGETKPLISWVDDPRCAVKKQAMRNRVFRGWSDEKVITTPPANRGQKSWLPSPGKVTEAA